MTVLPAVLSARQISREIYGHCAAEAAREIFLRKVTGA